MRGQTDEKEQTDLHDDDGFLDDVADACPNEVEEHVHAPLRRDVNFHRRLPNCLDTLAHKVHVDL
jgi:hypothetical protein